MFYLNWTQAPGGGTIILPPRQRPSVLAQYIRGRRPEFFIFKQKLEKLRRIRTCIKLAARIAAEILALFRLMADFVGPPAQPVDTQGA